VARFEHNPITFESLGLEIEEQRTNLLTYSEQLNDAAWVKTRTSVTANTVIAPDGTLTGDQLVEDSSASTTHLIDSSAASGALNTIHVASFFIKAAERTKCIIGFDVGSAFSNFQYGLYDLSAGTSSILFGTPTLSITPYPNGWYRCSVTAAATGTATANVALQTYTTSNGYIGDGTSGIYIWGAQLEAGAFPTSYIPTVASTRTRAADSASITGKNFSEWYRQDEGTFFVKSPNDQNTFGAAFWSTQRVLDVFGPRFQLGLSGDFAMVNDAGAVPFQIGSSPSYPKRIASAYKLGDYAQSNEGRLVSSTANTICTGQTVLQIGELVNSYLNGTVSRLTYYPKRLPNAQLQTLTR
jgi:hypothetical protein